MQSNACMIGNGYGPISLGGSWVSGADQRMHAARFQLPAALSRAIRSSSGGPGTSDLASVPQVQALYALAACLCSQISLLSPLTHAAAVAALTTAPTAAPAHAQAPTCPM
jgi:hypothetical protein